MEYLIFYTDGTSEGISADTEFLATQWAYLHRQGQTVLKVEAK